VCESIVRARDLADRVFQVGPDYRLIPRGKLTAADRLRLGVDTSAADFDGILVPSGASLPVKAIAADTAALLRTLQRPGPLPHRARQLARANARALQRLVLDSVLAVQDGDRFVTGPAAGRLLGLVAHLAPARTRLARLSRAALAYVEALPIASAAALSDRLYFYDRAPPSPAWAARLRTSDDVVRFLGAGEACGALLASEWTAVKDQAISTDWLVWHARRRPRATAPYKLYINVAAADLPEAFAVTLTEATAGGVVAVKVGSNLHGLLRPDKFVLYVRRRQDVRSVGGSIARALRGARIHGTPFTAAVDADALVSWGMDPPARTPSRPLTPSWRRSITDRLAVALLAARSIDPSNRALTPAQFALQRLHLDGVDPGTWAPVESEWEGFAGARG
jgi:hypothetical protein